MVEVLVLLLSDGLAVWTGEGGGRQDDGGQSETVRRGRGRPHGAMSLICREEIKSQFDDKKRERESVSPPVWPAGSSLTRTGCCNDLTASAAQIDPTLDRWREMLELVTQSKQKQLWSTDGTRGGTTSNIYEGPGALGKDSQERFDHFISGE